MQNSKTNELAAVLKEMKNPKTIGISVGKVIKKDPLSVAIADGKVILAEGEELLVCERLKKKEYNAKFVWESGTIEGEPSDTIEGKITIDPKIKAGDQILVVPMADEQIWIAVDRIEE